MSVQRRRMREILRELKARGVFTVGGPWVKVADVKGMPTEPPVAWESATKFVPLSCRRRDGYGERDESGCA